MRGHVMRRRSTQPGSVRVSQMPIMTREEQLAAIAAGRLGAVSIDTTVFDSKQRNFRNAALRSLS